MLVHVLLYDAGGDSEGIHSLELAGSTVVLMFENRDDAERYAGLLEAQDFPVPNIEAIDREEIEIFCRQAGYEARLVESGFVPTTDEERLLLAPPSANRDVSGWEDEAGGQSSQPVEQTDELEEFRRRLENLL
ncbi:DUF3110 domain-containing protein [Synechococcus sp. BS55D]|uniref:DUF3110 domain-containing protein n=1 Tax=Synechococcus sp. BS55D TaxID=2055943 RepID=UPI00103BF0E5|nr:DUF3110 domain-containing protein [Synechococcus sp. BS55D]TCD57220.1 DUF3110 domain-containing protein [Synechococcus sp. BS55D]